ncbi:hypothetical protein SLS62_009208 [Diatrype stigma]|uniref:HECT domain-containing protein n=1 Tax=Diatrype stigma TaxID=117547 RepID=A0AAN9UQF0_9PEZI
MTRNVIADLSEHGEHGEHGSSPSALEADVLAALWEQVPFPRLPFDAPAELKELVMDIENPKRVYNIHRASRRHYLQLLVERFVAQLRYGCGSSDCSTPSCFTCRRRLAGKAPIRRYNPTSARTLAVYLAGQDNPESRLCPNLQPPTQPSDSIKPLAFSTKCNSHPSETKPRRLKPTAPGQSQTDGPKEQPKPKHIRAPERILPIHTPVPIARRNSSNHDRIATDPEQTDESPAESSDPTQVHITEKAVIKDYRSFAANVFGTVAFKMLEWLTPNTLEAIAEKAETAFQDSTRPHDEVIANPSPTDDPEERLSEPSTVFSSDVQPPLRNNAPTEDDLEDIPVPAQPSNREPTSETGRGCNFENQASLESPAPRRRLSHTRKRSHARIRTSSLTKPPSKGQIESIPSDPGSLSPTTRPSHAEIVSKGLVRPSSNITRTSSQLSIDKSLETESDEHNAVPETRHSQNERQLQAESTDRDCALGSTGIPASTPDETLRPQAVANRPDSTSELDSFLPQSLSHFNMKTIDFICDVIQEDATGESHLLEPPSLSHHESAKHRSNQPKPWRRKQTGSKRYPRNLRLEWKLFVEQSIFSVLSDPRAVLESFTNRDGLIDSHSLWYCMLRLTRVAPSIVFHSLWIALSGLFAPPKPLQSSRSPASKLFPPSENSFTNTEAGFIMSICLHALVAAAPLVKDPRQLIDMSRIRAHGFTLTNGGAVAVQPTSLCLQYEDAFTDDLALRLAKRLLTVIPARRRFDLLMEYDQGTDREQDKDIVEVFLAHLEFTSQSPLNVPKAEGSMHEKRMPIVILDWARAVMFNEWEGKADVPKDGPFGGALALTAAMYQKRQSLLLGDMSFFAEYFGERLDSVQMPVSWLSFDSAQRVHLLNHPYLFTPASRVSYFRAINFSRMSRAHEEASSLQGRIESIIKHGSLITELHHKMVLQDLLKVPSSRYLILSIGRETVLEDAFDQLWRREERELMRPLKVHLGEDGGEEGFDSGGVQQEFFRLAIAEALNPDYGAFTVDERTHMTWFQPGSLQPEWKFELVGLLLSLAVYNGLTLPITFPKAFYQKLLGEPVTELHHIADGWPELANGLTTLLEWNERDGSVEDVFSLTYEFSASMFGQPVSRKMQPAAAKPGWDNGGEVVEGEDDGDEDYVEDGSEWPQLAGCPPDAEPPAASNPTDAPSVTGDNRNAYVSDYIRYLTTVSVAPQFEALARGFRRCLQGPERSESGTSASSSPQPQPKSLSLLTPALLQSLVEGEAAQEIDIAELRRAARYVGWDATHRSVRDFWAVVRRYDARMRRRLLEFVTASDRVPVGGVANVQFVIQRNGEEQGDQGHLPTAYTCYGTLLLPEYRDREVLRERLGMALENAQGFGFA